MMRPMSVIAALVLAGCGAVQSDLVTGSFGGNGLLLTASSRTVHLQLACMKASFPEPMRVAPDGSFELQGAISATSWGGAIGTPARLMGTVNGEEVSLRFEWRPGEEWVGSEGAATLVRDEPMVRPAGSCLA